MVGCGRVKENHSSWAGLGIAPSEVSQDAQRAQYPLIKEYTLNNTGIHIMI